MAAATAAAVAAVAAADRPHDRMHVVLSGLLLSSSDEDQTEADAAEAAEPPAMEVAPLRRPFLKAAVDRQNDSNTSDVGEGPSVRSNAPARAPVPERCVVAGSALFSSCSAEINAAQAFFPTQQQRGFSQHELLHHLQLALDRPSKECCAAQCCFNQLLLCDCEPSVLQVAATFAGAGAGAGADKAQLYGLMVSQLSASCGIRHFYGASCPSRSQPLAPSAAAAACAGRVPWPPVVRPPEAGEPQAVCVARSDGDAAVGQENDGGGNVGDATDDG